MRKDDSVGRFLRRSLITAVAASGLFVGVVVAAAALPTTTGRTLDSARSATVSPSLARPSAAIKSLGATKEGTRTTILSIYPPAAQSSSTPVTIVVSVTGKGSRSDRVSDLRLLHGRPGEYRSHEWSTRHFSSKRR